MDLKPTIMCPTPPDEFRVSVPGTRGTLTISRIDLTDSMKDELAAEWRKKLDEPSRLGFRDNGMITSRDGLGKATGGSYSG